MLCSLDLDISLVLRYTDIVRSTEFADDESLDLIVGSHVPVS